MYRDSIVLIAALMSGVLLTGCATGYNSILFATKSNFGVDVDTQPPAADIGITRFEGTIAPVFEGGQTLPVLSSFRPEVKGLFAGNVSQTFSTGDAAQAMAVLFGAENPCKDITNIPSWNDCYSQRTALSSKLTVTAEPISKTGYPLQKENVRPVFFGTSTSVGLSVTWSGMEAVVPEGFHFGYRRKELALAPVSRSDETVNGKTTKYVGVPSLIATIDSNYSAGAPQDLKFKWIQYFATGKAATALSLQRDVRIAMLRRLDPQQLPLLFPGDLNATRIGVLLDAHGYVSALAAKNNEKAKTLSAGLNSLHDIVPSSYQFSYRQFSPDNKDLLITQKQDAPIDFSFQGYRHFHEYWSRMNSTIENIHIALADTYVGTVDGKTKAEKIDQLKAELQAVRLLKQQLDSEVRKNATVQEAVYFYLTNPT